MRARRRRTISGVLQARPEAKVPRVSGKPGQAEGRAFHWNRRPKAILQREVSMRARGPKAHNSKHRKADIKVAGY
jgi:hypothetical protein